MKFFRKTAVYFLLVLFFLFHFSFFADNASASIFSDVPETHPNYEAIRYLYKRGIINGYPDKTFRPSRKVNRAEAIKIFLLGSHLHIPETTETGGYPDVVSESWYAKYVVKAKKLGIIKGYPNGYFKPQNTINFAEALKMLLKTNNITINKETKKSPFKGIPKDAWFAKYFSYAKENNILSDFSLDKIIPGKEISREDISLLMYRLSLFLEENKEKIYASFYDDKFHGRTTASGETFDQNKFTAANLTLKFGTKVKITNVENGKSVIVVVNDRGPYYPKNRMFDLTKAAFQEIAPLSKGIVEIVYEELKEDEVHSLGPSVPPAQDSANCKTPEEKENINTDFFDSIKLSSPLPTTFQKNEVYLIEGHIEDKNKETAPINSITVFYRDKNKTDKNFVSSVSEGKFAVPISFSGTGNFNIGIIPGLSGSSKVKEIKVIELDCIPVYKKENLKKPFNLKVKLKDNKTRFEWNNHGMPLSRIEIYQGENKVIHILNNSISKWIADAKEFKDFSAGEAYFRISIANTKNNSSLSQTSEWVLSNPKQFVITQHYSGDINKEKIEISSLTETYIFGGKIEISGKVLEKTRTEAYAILPNGQTEKINISSNKSSFSSVSDFKIIPQGGNFSLSLTPKSKGTYIIEINNENGEAIFNYPIYEENFIPLIPDFTSLNSRENYKTDRNKDMVSLKNDLLDLINKERVFFGSSQIELSDKLSLLAQMRAEDMAEENYFSHWDAQGKDVNDWRLNFQIKTSISENLAKDIDIIFAHEGLMRSAIHRKNIISEEWTRVGIGIAQSQDNYLIITEEFSSDPVVEDQIPMLRDELLGEINSYRNTPLSFNSNLNAIAQTWSNSMDKLDFFDFTSPDGKSLATEVRNSDIFSTFGVYIIGNSKWEEAKMSVIKDAESKITDNKWKKIGIGISQNNLGVIKITLIYAE